MKHFILSVCLFVWAATVYAQKGKINISVTDQQQKPIDGVFAELLNARDSSMVKYSISQPNGSAEFDGLGGRGVYSLYSPNRL